MYADTNTWKPQISCCRQIVHTKQKVPGFCNSGRKEPIHGSGSLSYSDNKNDKIVRVEN